MSVPLKIKDPEFLDELKRRVKESERAFRGYTPIRGRIYRDRGIVLLGGLFFSTDEHYENVTKVLEDFYNVKVSREKDRTLRRRLTVDDMVEKYKETGRPIIL